MPDVPAITGSSPGAPRSLPVLPSRSVEIRLLIATAVLLAAPPARANPEATQLFREGQEKMRAGQFEAACDRFERSARLVRKVGTLLNLGDCYERRRKLASAWHTFDEAAVLARQTSDPRGAEATRRAQLLKPHLPYLTIVADTSIPGLAIRKNATVIDAATWNVPIAVDPDTYVIEASAPGYAPWSAREVVEASGNARVTVALVAVADRIAHVEPPPVPPHTSRESSLRDVGLGIVAGSNSRERPLIGAMALANLAVPGGALRGVFSAVYSRYEDDVANDPTLPQLETIQTYYVNIGVDYFWVPTAPVGIGGGLGVGIELDHDKVTGYDLGSALQLRASAVGRLRDGHVEAGLHLQCAFAGSEVTLHGLVGIAWFP